MIALLLACAGAPQDALTWRESIELLGILDGQGVLDAGRRRAVATPVVKGARRSTSARSSTHILHWFVVHDPGCMPLGLPFPFP